METNSTAAEDGFSQASDILDENASKLKASLCGVKEDLYRLEIPLEYWEDAKVIKTDLRRLTVKIESFVRRSKASLEFAINATRNKKLFEWMASVERSFATISTEIDSLLLNVSDTKALIEDLKKKVMKGADDAHWWAVACLSISVIGYVAAIASGLAISVVAAPYFIPFAIGRV